MRRLLGNVVTGGWRGTGSYPVATLVRACRGRTVWHARGPLKDGGREGIRTPGLLVANEALSQLSYSPTSSNTILANALMLANTRSSVHKQIGRPRRRTPVDPEMPPVSGSYGCSMDPPARWATIFLAF